VEVRGSVDGESTVVGIPDVRAQRRVHVEDGDDALDGDVGCPDALDEVVLDAHGHGRVAERLPGPGRR
jgi:hypothetical protein